MFTEVTYQDMERAEDKAGFIAEAVKRYRESADFKKAIEANAYFEGRNPAVMKRYLLKAEVETETDERGRSRRRARTVRVPGNRLPSGFFRRVVMQQNQYLLSGGVMLKDPESKERLGMGFDKALEQMGERALVQGVCWGFFNCDHLEVMPAARGECSGFMPLYDEETGKIGAGAEFWQIGEGRDEQIRVFEKDGVTRLSVRNGTVMKKGRKVPYVRRVSRDGAGEMTESAGWEVLPVIPLYANNEKCSELTPSVKQKIDAYDLILSDLGNNLERANDVYWVLNNFGGQMQQALEVQEQMNRLKMVINQSDGGTGGASADVRTVEVPYKARETALMILRRELYADAMALDMEALTGGSLTNVAIRAAMADLDLKTDGFEWQCFLFVQKVLAMLGIRSEEIVFKRQSISNAHETVQDIYLMRADIDRRTALTLNPYIDQDVCARLCGEEECR